MGRYLTPGHTYVDGSTVTGPNLTEHVEEASFNTTAWTEQTVNPTPALTDQVLIVAGDEFFQETLQQIHDLILYPGSVVQTIYSEYVANTNLTAIIPVDDTIPQNTEGTQILSAAITPRFATSTILAQFSGQWSINAVVSACAALFRDAVVPAVASQFDTSEVSGTARGVFNLMYMDSPATTSATTYKIRVGPGAAGTMRMNGAATTRVHGGTARATLVLQEIKV